MAYTISDVQSAYAGSLRLVAGEGGLARPVHEVGILDYELLPDVKSRFQRVNFYEGQLVLSTFLYAKDNPFLITEAVKYLVSKGSSGLIIKNVFHLQIPDGAIRYANARNFPLFVTVGDSFLFDQVIVAVDHARKQAESLESVQQEIDRLAKTVEYKTADEKYKMAILILCGKIYDQKYGEKVKNKFKARKYHI